VLMNQGKVEQIGSPQEVWDQPASPFVYGFLGDVNLFHGRAHEGEVNVEGIRIASPEHASAQNAKAFAYVRPHDIDVQLYKQQAAADQGNGDGIIAKLDRAIVIGPIARLELIPNDDSRPAGGPLVDSLIEAQLPAQQFRELGLKEGDTVVLTPRKARVFVDAGEGI
jgi:sulfate/thiosulfate transport system ATP-binding protein